MGVRARRGLLRVLAWAPIASLLAGCGEPRPIVRPILERGSIGLFARVVRESTVLRDFTVEEGTSILVTRVEAGGPADRAGIRGGDVLLSIEGKKVRTAAQTINLVQNSSPGSVLHLKLARERAEYDTVVTVERLQLHPVIYRKPQEMPDPEGPVPAPEPSGPAPDRKQEGSTDEK